MKHLPQSPKERRVWWERRTHAISVLLTFVLLIFLLQLWLMTIALEEHLGAGHALALPTFLASGGCFLLNLRLLKYVNDLDRQHRDQ